jgi:ribonuclease D
MGKTGNSSVCEAPSRAATTSHLEVEASPYEQFREENLKVLYLRSDAEVRQAAAFVRSLNPSVIALDFETSSKTGYFGELNGSFDGAIRLIQLGFKEEGIEPFQIVIDCHDADPKPFLPLLRTAKIEKQIHHMDFEQSWALTHLGVSIGNIYDTCIASRIIQSRLYQVVVENGLEAAQKISPEWTPNGQKYRDTPEDEKLRAVMEKAGLPAAQKLVPGWEPHDNRLSTISANYMGLELPKENQVSDWGREKISASQLTYAAMDVAILPDLTTEVKEMAAAVGVEEEIDLRIKKTKESIIKRVAEAEERRDDDSRRITRAMKRAKTKDEIDQVFAAGRQMTVKAKAQEEIRQMYRELRSELP